MRLVDLTWRDQLECRIFLKINPIDIYASLMPETPLADIRKLSGFPQLNATILLPLCILDRTMREIDYVTHYHHNVNGEAIRRFEKDNAAIERARKRREIMRPQKFGLNQNLCLNQKEPGTT